MISKKTKADIMINRDGKKKLSTSSGKAVCLAVPKMLKLSENDHVLMMVALSG